MSYHKKAQVWIGDFVIGFLIFTIGLILASRFMFYSMHDNDFDRVKAEAGTLTNYFLSEGVPSDWNNDTIVRLGLTTDHQLNKTKLSYLFNMSYEKSKEYLVTNYDYLFFFQKNGTPINITKCGYGKIMPVDCVVDISGLEKDNLVKISRYTIYNNSIIEVVFYVWD